MNLNKAIPTEDANGQVTDYEYETDTLRPKKTIYPNYAYTETEYSDKLISNPADLLPGFVRTTTTLDTNKYSQSYTYINGKGQTIRSAAETPDGWSIGAVEYDDLGRPRKTYNPFYGSTPVAAIPGGTAYSAVTEMDLLGRTTEVTLQDGTKVETEYGQGTDFNYVTVTDQAGKQRRQLTDALGRVVRVDEPYTNGALGTLASPAQPTYYEYDANDNLAKVTQSDGTTTQERKFLYDSLSRLIAERQVEADPTLSLDGTKGTADSSKWTKVLKYDADGLLEWGVDARGVKTAFAYDGLNRVASVTYTGESGYQTPNVTYTYDQARSGYFNLGRLTKVETADVSSQGTFGTAHVYDYDKMGNVVNETQTIGGQDYDLAYSYNLAGQLVSQTYPSGRVVNYGFDDNGRLEMVADAQRTYLASVEYGAAGSISQMAYGSGTTESFTINDRFQVTSQSLAKVTNIIQKFDYSYGKVNTGTGSVDATKNNGQLGKIEGWMSGNKEWSQRFGYDELGRLSEASEYKESGARQLIYKQNFDFDRFGNMYRKAANNGTSGQETPLPYTPIEDSDISRSTNRFTSDTTYDEAGSIISDAKFRGLGYAYDANNRMVKVTAASRPDALSVYDALGNRIAARVDDAWQVTIYDAFGKCVAEYDDQEPDGGGGLSYVMSDWQGSVRLVTNAHGFVRSRTDYTAFGEKIGAGVGSRTQAQGFGTDSPSKQGYGLTEKDAATGLDHTWFRKNENQAGRWTSPDPYGGSMNIANPQSFNRYSYVQNKPTNFVDPSGLLEEGDRCLIFDGDYFYEGTYRNGQCVGNLSDTFEVTSHWSDPTVLTGPAAILYMWNPAGNTTYINVLDTVGGGNGFSPPSPPPPNPCDVLAKNPVFTKWAKKLWDSARSTTPWLETGGLFGHEETTAGTSVTATYDRLSMPRSMPDFVGWMRDTKSMNSARNIHWEYWVHAHAVSGSTEPSGIGGDLSITNIAELPAVIIGKNGKFSIRGVNNKLICNGSIGQ